jgi:hypothetical protein
VNFFTQIFSHYIKKNPCIGRCMAREAFLTHFFLLRVFLTQNLALPFGQYADLTGVFSVKLSPRFYLMCVLIFFNKIFSVDSSWKLWELNVPLFNSVNFYQFKKTSHFLYIFLTQNSRSNLRCRFFFGVFPLNPACVVLSFQDLQRNVSNYWHLHKIGEHFLRFHKFGEQY